MNKIKQMALDFVQAHGDFLVEDIEDMAAEWVLHNPKAETKLFTQNYIGFWDSWCEYADLWCKENNWGEKINEAIAEESTNEQDAHAIRYDMLMEGTNTAGIYTISDKPEDEEIYCAVWRNMPKRRS